MGHGQSCGCVCHHLTCQVQHREIGTVGTKLDERDSIDDTYGVSCENHGEIEGLKGTILIIIEVGIRDIYYYIRAGV